MNISRCEKDVQETTEARFHGADMAVSYREKNYEGFNWKCNGCGLVWRKKHLAAGCEGRKHVTRFFEYYGGRIENGVHVGGAKYAREAIRRERTESK